MGISKKTIITGATTGIAALALGVFTLVPALAQEGQGGFMERVSEVLGVETQDLEEAITVVRTEDIDQMVTDGKITEEEAADLKANMEERGVGFGFMGKDHQGRLQFGSHEEVAEFLGLESDELRGMHDEGLTLAEIADKQGKTREELISFLQYQMEERLNEAVENGDMDQDKADEIYETSEEHINERIDSLRSEGRGERGMGSRGMGFAQGS